MTKHTMKYYMQWYSLCHVTNYCFNQIFSDVQTFYSILYLHPYIYYSYERNLVLSIHVLLYLLYNTI